MKQPNDTKRKNSNSGSLGQLFRARGRMTHLSKKLEVVWAEQIGGDVRLFGCVEFYGVSPERGKTLDLGRNKAKREKRAKAA